MPKLVNSYHTEFSGGIGDFLRGSIYLHNRCQQNNIDFDIDFSCHPISEFIFSNYDQSYDTEFILDIEHLYLMRNNGKSPPNWIAEIEKVLNFIFLNMEQTKEDIIVSSYYIEVLKQPNFLNHIQNYIVPISTKHYLQQNIKFSDEVNSLFNALQLDDYSVFHYRMGDRSTLQNLSKELHTLPISIQTNYNLKEFQHDYLLYYLNIEQYIAKNNINTLIVMSDSNEFKQFINEQNNPKIKTIHTLSTHTCPSPGHLRYSSFKQELSRDQLLHTALDIKLLTQSKQNVSYSSYAWGSGFVTWISKIYDIPVKIEHIFK